MPFGILHSTYIRRPQDLKDMLVFIYMLSLFRCFAGSITGPYARPCSRTSRGATHFPMTNTRATVIPRRSLRRSLYNIPRRGDTHSKKISVQHPQATSRLTWMHPPGAETFGSEVSCQMYTDGSSCVLWAWDLHPGSTNPYGGFGTLLGGRHGLASGAWM